MNSILFILATAFSFQAATANTYNKAEWEKWKTKTYEKHQTSKTSFLNATSLSHVEKGAQLYLVKAKNRQKTEWLTEKPAKYIAVAKHLGATVELVIGNNKPIILTKKQRKHMFDLKNGAIAQVTLGRRVGKLWGYIYDPDQIKSFSGFRFYDFNEKAITQGQFIKMPREVVSYKTVQGDPAEVAKVGEIKFQFKGKNFQLNAYNWQKPKEPIKYLAIVFTDKQAGKETYAGGRELAVMFKNKPPKNGEKFTMDFNRTGNFYCAHSPFWHCPVGLQQHLDSLVDAGEMLPIKKIALKR